MFGISFLSPLFLIGAAAAVIPILLHLFHRRTDVVIDFPAVRLLKRGPIEQHRRRRLREVILLALRVTALVLLAVSFARPYLAGAVAPESAPLTVVAADVSMSLSAPGQIERVREAAQQAIRSAPGPHAVALVAFADAATVVVPPTLDRALALAAAAQLTAGPGGTRYRTALARAAELAGVREARVVVITDLQQAGWEVNDDGGLPDGVGVEVVTIPPPPSNVAVTSAERRDRTIVATVQNYGAAPASVPVALLVDGTTVANVTVDVAALSATEARLTGELPGSGAARVVVDDAAGYQGDNIRHVVLDPPPAVSIAVIVADPTGATGGLYLERALSVAGGGREFRVDVVDGRAFSRWTAAAVAHQAALVVLGTRTLDRTGRERIKSYLNGGGQLWLSLGPDIDPATLADVIGADLGVTPAPVAGPSGGATMVASDGRHPIFRPFLNPSGALGDVQVDQHRRLNDHTGRTVLARFSGGDPALTEQAVGRGRLLIFTSDLDNLWSRFPLSPAFVPFAVETARYLTAGRQQRQAWVLPDTPRGVAAVPGVARVGAGTSGYSVALNVNVRESNPATTSVDEFTSGIERTSRSGQPAPGRQAREVEDRQRWWQIGLLVMLAALAGEGLVGRRAT